MKPREIRQYILTDHTVLRQILDQLDRQAIRVLEGREDELPVLRDRGLWFYAKFAEHLAFEDRCLAPMLRDAGFSGLELSTHLEEDHREQRELMRYILSGLRNQTRPAQVVAGELRSLVELILADMADEESTILSATLLRDPALRPSRGRDASHTLPNSDR